MSSTPSPPGSPPQERSAPALSGPVLACLAIVSLLVLAAFVGPVIEDKIRASRAREDSLRQEPVQPDAEVLHRAPTADAGALGSTSRVVGLAQNPRRP